MRFVWNFLQLLVFLSPLIVLVWVVLRKRKMLWNFVKGHRWISIALSPLIVAVLGILLLCWTVFFAMFGSIGMSFLARYVPHDPPSWTEDHFDECFSISDGVEVLAGGDPAHHQFNEHVCDYVIHFTDPQKAEQFRRQVSEVMSWSEWAHGPLNHSYSEDFENHFTLWRSTDFVWRHGRTRHLMKIYEGKDNYFYISDLILIDPN